METGNVFEALPVNLPKEITQTLLSHEDIRIERIVSKGQASPEGFWYDQSEHEWVLLLKGSAGLEIEGEEAIRSLKEGDFLFLPAHQKHRVVWTDADTETVWLAVFFQ
jgi:cupin 2 domain-containing protein